MFFTALAFAHFFQNGAQAQTEPLVVPDEVSAEGGSNQKGREILALLDDLKKIRLDENVFSDPVFQSLKDLSVVLMVEPRGRPNPFAPIGKDAFLSETGGFATTSPRGIPFSSGN